MRSWRLEETWSDLRIDCQNRVDRFLFLMQLSLLDAYTELSAFEAIQGTDAEALFPRLLASSMPSSQDSLQTALAMDSEQAQQPIPPISELPWVVLEQCSERPLSAAEISEDCAVALGKAVASLHAVHRGM